MPRRGWADTGWYLITPDLSLPRIAERSCGVWISPQMLQSTSGRCGQPPQWVRIHLFFSLADLQMWHTYNFMVYAVFSMYIPIERRNHCMICICMYIKRCLASNRLRISRWNCWLCMTLPLFCFSAEDRSSGTLGLEPRSESAADCGAHGTGPQRSLLYEFLGL